MDKDKQGEKKKNERKFLELFMGTYEGKIICIRLDPKKKKTNSVSFKSSENCLKVSKLHQNYLFVSGNDEIIRIYDINKLEEKGEIMSYSGTNTHLEISKNYLLLGGMEKTVSIWRMSDFNQVHLLKGHTQAISSIRLHSSNKILLSSSFDKSFIMWNMLTGIKILKHQFSSACQQIVPIKTHPDLFVLLFEKNLMLIDITKYKEEFDDMIIKRHEIDSKIVHAFYFKLSLYVFTSDNKVLIFKDFLDVESDNKFTLDVEKPSEEGGSFQDLRVKIVNEIYSPKLNVVTIVFSNNEVYIYDLNKTNDKYTEMNSLKKFHSIKLSNERITCLDGRFSSNAMV